MIFCENVAYAAPKDSTQKTALSASSLNQRAFRLTTVSPSIALVNAEAALQQAFKENNLQEQARAYSTIGVVLRYQDRYDSALVYQNRARAIFEQIRDTTGLTDVLLNIGGVYQSRGDYSGVMDNCFQALALCEKRGEKRGMARSYASIGIGYVLQGDLPKALEFQQKALYLRTELSDKSAIAHSWRNLGLIYERMNILDSALWYYNQALEQFDRIGDIQGVALALGSLGSRYERAGDSKKAREYHFKVIPLYEELGDRRGLAVVQNSLSSGFLREKKYAEALQYGQRALAIAESIGALVEERDAMKNISDAHSALGNESLAFAFFRRHVERKDSITMLQNSRRIAELQGRYDLARKDRALVEAEHQRQLERINAESLRLSLVIATLVFLAILGLVVNGYRIKRRSEKVLRSQNEEIVHQQHLLRTQAEEISQANERLQESNTELVQLNTEKNEFLGIAAHDLKNPLSNMLLTVQLMDEYHASVPSEKFREWTESITRGAEYMLNIISNLLDVNKIEAGKMEMNIEPVNASIIELITDAYTFRASEKGIHLHFTPLKSKIHFLADRNSIQQIMENLISNAIKFSEKETTVVVRTVQHNTTVQIEVQDAGPGLSPDDKAKLFGKFARLSARPTGGEHSTGLGLSIVKKMVEAMNGKVWCESELGKGATFIVELPKA